MKTPPTEILAAAVAELGASSDGAALPIQPRPILEAVASVIDDITVTQHPLGFMHFELTPLLPSLESRRVRLHLWTQDSLRWADDLGSVHDHNWELNSLVLVGGLVDKVLRAVESEAGSFVATRVTYAVDALEFEDQAGTFELEEELTRRVDAGHAYRLRPGLLHFTEVSKVPTATLVEAVTTAAKSALVFRPRNSKSTAKTERPRVMKTDSMAALQSAVAV